MSHLVGAILLDAALVTAFAATGRATHGEDALAGLWQTAWPFLGGLVIGWLATRAWRAPAAPLRTGLGVWAATIVVGMLLRAVSGQGTALPFVIVATVVLFAALVGWRAIAALVARRRR
ncbi:DUF3054 family protein [Agromyces sp. CFH 90414]|uniref:DUF3054 family protein n=1 Tax=Agromyces agglutinans TaxID=2662258 RepID=A0A6I2F0N7_9MICO|nr:DUF3054 family protein [Agromyces agglutinans]